MAPNLDELVGRALGAVPGDHPDSALRLARVHRLPLALVAAATGLALAPSWERPLAAERAALVSRTVTVEVVRGALGPAVLDVAVGGAAWRPLDGSDVDLLVPAARFAEVCRRLSAGGLVEVRRHRGPGRAAYVRLEHGVVDLVDVEAVAAGDLAAADSGFATLRAGPAAVRLLRKVSARGEVLLRDLADLTAIGADRIPARLDAPAARGRTAVAAVQRRLDAGPVPEPVPVGELLGGAARLAAGAARASATARARRWGAPALVVLTASATPLADGLETDLQKAAVDVLRLDQPEPARLLRSLARGLLDRAVVVVTDPPARWPAGPHLRLTSGDRSELVTAVLHQLR